MSPLTHPPDHATLIVNAHSRHGMAWFDAAEHAARECGMRLDEAHAAKSQEELTALVRACSARRTELVVVGGGDGTLRVAAQALVHSETALGIIPLGTVNDFARNLHVEPTPGGACRILREGRIVRIDLGQANDHVFTITASVGFSALMQESLTPRLKRMLGSLAYFVASLRTWRRLRHFTITISGDHPQETLIITQAGLVNGHSWMGGRFEIPGVDLESGRLAFYAVPPGSQMDYLRMILTVRRGGFFRTPGMRAFTTADLTMVTRRPHPLVLDGDIVGETPTRFRVLRDALRVVVPQDYAKPDPTPSPSHSKEEGKQY